MESHMEASRSKDHSHPTSQLTANEETGPQPEGAGKQILSQGIPQGMQSR